VGGSDNPNRIRGEGERRARDRYTVAVVRTDPLLVGRDAELELLRGALEAAAAGRGSVVSISGEPGVGKTAVARAFASSAVPPAGQALWGDCFEGDSQASYGPWLVALSQLGATPGPGPELSPPEGKLEFFSAVHEKLVATAAEVPVLVVLDDLHWAGTDSLELFGFLAARVERSRIVLTGTYRDPDPAVAAGRLTAVVGSLARLPYHLRVGLRGLDPDAVGRYLSEAIGGGVPGAIVRAVHEQTSGNPFFIREVALALLDERKLVHRDGRWLSDSSVADLGIPATVRHTVRARVAGLSEPARELLLAASAFTADMDLDTARSVAGLTEEAALDAVDEALAVGLFRQTGRAAAPYAFAHAIVRHALAESLIPDRRTRLHRRAAQVLEDLRPDDHAAIAEQYWLSRWLAGAERGITHSFRAAEEAANQHGYQQAVRALEIALELVPSEDEDARLDVLRRLAVAQADALDHGRAPATTLAALAGIDPTAGAELVVRVVEALREGAPASSWEPLVARGLELLGGRRDAGWARLVVAAEPVEAVSSGSLYAGSWRGHPLEAVAALRASGSEDDEARAIEPFAARSEAETEALLARAGRWSSQRARIRALDVAGRDFIFRHGRPLAAIECYRELLEVGERVGSLPARAEACSQLALCLALVGEIGEAQDQLLRAGALVRDLWPGHRLHMLGTLSSSVIVGYVVGEADWKGMASRLTGWVKSPAAARAPFANVFAVFSALCHAFAGAGTDARLLLRDSAAILARMAPHEHAVAGSLWFAAATAWELRDREAASWVLPLVDRHERAAGPPGPFGSLDHAAGRMAALLGDTDDAGRRFGLARAAMDRAGIRGVRALVDMDDAVLRGQSGLASEARSAFEDLGMPGWAARLGKVAWPSSGPRPAGLTEREAEVLRLLAGGRTSKEIAADLVVSPLTVSRHIANVYAKINVRNRAEATAFAIAHGILT
jgi:DNA-binding CsgD family transcriptional regulator/tetratricopeptide (TPR) repeat protein